MRRPLALAILAVLLPVLTGCGLRSGAAVSESGWTDKVDQTLGAAISSLGTTEVVLKNQANGHLTRSYVVVAVRDSQRTLAKEVQTFGSKQPPASKVADKRTAMRALGHALAVLDSASNAASGADIAARRTALLEVERTYQELSTLQTRLTGGGG
ncbi:hypothetical protein [Nocardioides marmorisolisilvae]|uniref:Uncharacterized protein n=1 Tax=Nocardioides marmorisolisilvae TaxID=1542737 RepID=A0A3N0DTL3_9ACTN|nr:hypothetical protein [Nocardioides marmorisolisilvae]RNL78974.1 hypothetical protein EFL95_07950 [Nocardioides marmorisolisilvae]